MRVLWKTLAVAVAMMFGSLSAATAAEQWPSWPVDHVEGKADAPNTIIEYFSLGCPHCADFHAETWPKLKAAWVDTGKARMIFRDYPLDGRALAAAMVAQCSGNRYLAFVDAYFRTQRNWEEAQDGLDAIKTIARLGGMTDAEVDACWKREDLIKLLNDRKNEAAARGIDSTPTFVINGKTVTGAVPYATIEQALK